VALFRFQINDDPVLHAPVELDLPDEARAEIEAVELLVDMARAPDGPLSRDGHFGVTVRDGRGRLIVRLSLVASHGGRTRRR
jgi:hypothetical protein